MLVLITFQCLFSYGGGGGGGCCFGLVWFSLLLIFVIVVFCDFDFSSMFVEVICGLS